MNTAVVMIVLLLVYTVGDFKEVGRNARGGNTERGVEIEVRTRLDEDSDT